MITQRAEALKKEYEKAIAEESLVVQQTLSEMLFLEIIERCRPTEAEFVRLMDSVIVTSLMLFWIIAGVPSGKRLEKSL